MAPAGERQPGVRFSLREPLGLSMTEDGLLFVATTYGITSFDPLAREAETLVLWGGIDELRLPVDVRLSVVGLTGSSALVHTPTSSGANVVRLDIDRMSSERNPTRTLAKLATGEVELTDTTSAIVERFDVAGRLILRRKRTGETMMAVTYLDARTDAIDRITDAVGGQTVFAYSGGKIQSITDARGRTTQLSVNGFGDLVSLPSPATRRIASRTPSTG